MKLQSFRIYTIFFLTLFLLACSYRFDIGVSSSKEKGLNFILSHPLGGKSIELNRFMIVTQVAGDWDYKHPAWAFSLPPGTYSEVRNIGYGDVPEGFSEDRKPAKLLPKVSYMALGVSAGGGGSAEFNIGQ